MRVSYRLVLRQDGLFYFLLTTNVSGSGEATSHAGVPSVQRLIALEANSEKTPTPSLAGTPAVQACAVGAGRVRLAAGVRDFAEGAGRV